MPGTDELVRLEIPARPAFVGVARSVLATVVTTVEGVDDDRLEDLRLAVSEACTNAIGAEGSGDRVVVSCRYDDTSLEVRIEGSGAEAGADGGSERAWGLQLISALVDDVSFDRAESGTAVTLRVARQAGA